MKQKKRDKIKGKLILHKSVLKIYSMNNICNAFEGRYVAIVDTMKPFLKMNMTDFVIVDLR